MITEHWPTFSSLSSSPFIEPIVFHSKLYHHEVDRKFVSTIVRNYLNKTIEGELNKTKV